MNDSGDTVEDKSELEIIMARVNDAGELLTAPGGPYERRAELREIMVLFESGLFLVSKSHTDDPHLASFEGLLRRKGMEIERIKVDLAIIRKIYMQHEQANTLLAGDQTTSTMQRDILRLISDAADHKASDVHIVVGRDSSTVRIRVDGVMRNIHEWRVQYGADFCAAVFAMADASDASYQPYEYQGARVSDSTARLPEGVQAVRLQFNPLAMGGRHLVMRLLYYTIGEAGDVDTLGYSPPQVNMIKRMRSMPMGINIIAGPTGSGKSTTLQRVLSTLIEERRREISVFTVEDPPEYVIDGAQQMPVTNANTPEERAEQFHKAINASLRSDPDVIMIGEVRDRESAKLAFEAAMTGHQVWTTLHATDGMTIVSRLKDIGVEAYKLFDSTVVSGLVAQRLMRVVCPHCSLPFEEAYKLGRVDEGLWKRVNTVIDGDISLVKAIGDGCERCNQTGAVGRTVVSEVILPDDEMMAFLEKRDINGAHKYWVDNLAGMPMMHHGIEKIGKGISAPEEVERVLGPLETEAPEIAEIAASGF